VLQQHAARRCRTAGCYQTRSRSPVTSTENYALKIAAAYVLHPSRQNDCYYFLLRLNRPRRLDARGPARMPPGLITSAYDQARGDVPLDRRGD
jgi:hypothetical protein